MKLIKLIFIILLTIIILLLIIALFVKKEYTIEREIVINKSNSEVFNFVKFLKNQEQFSKWNQLDSNMKKEYNGIDGTIGFISAWESKNKNVGVGEQEIVKISEGKRIDIKVRFKVPFKTENDAYMITDSLTNNQTKVTWGFKGRFSYPLNLMRVFINMDKMIGNDFEFGLNNLKSIIEKKS